MPLQGSPKRLREYTTLSRPQQHSHNRETVLVNCLLQAKTVHVDYRGLEIALEDERVSLEAVRVSSEAVRVLIEALRCFRGLKRSLRMSIEAVRVQQRPIEAKKVPVEAVREPIGKTVLKNSGTHQNVLVFFQSFQIQWKSSAFVLKNSGTHQNVWVLFQSFQIKWKRFGFVSKFLDQFCFGFKKFWNTAKYFGFDSNVLDYIETSRFRF